MKLKLYSILRDNGDYLVSGTDPEWGDEGKAEVFLIYYDARQKAEKLKRQNFIVSVRTLKIVVSIKQITGTAFERI